MASCEKIDNHFQKSRNQILLEKERTAGGLINTKSKGGGRNHKLVKIKKSLEK